MDVDTTISQADFTSRVIILHLLAAVSEVQGVVTRP
jgi:hypothetical protein